MHIPIIHNIIYHPLIRIKLENYLDKNYFSKMISSRHPKLKPHIDEIKFLIDERDSILYSHLKSKINDEKWFAKLFIVRSKDIFEHILEGLIQYRYHSTLSLMRIQCEMLMFLKYVEKNPNYIRKFLKKKHRGININQLKKEIPNKKLNMLYDKLSLFFHVNPAGIKYTLYEDIKGRKAFTTFPINHHEIAEELINISIDWQKQIIKILKKINE